MPPSSPPIPLVVAPWRESLLAEKEAGLATGGWLGPPAPPSRGSRGSRRLRCQENGRASGREGRAPNLSLFRFIFLSAGGGGGNLHSCLLLQAPGGELLDAPTFRGLFQDPPSLPFFSRPGDPFLRGSLERRGSSAWAGRPNGRRNVATPPSRGGGSCSGCLDHKGTV